MDRLEVDKDDVALRVLGESKRGAGLLGVVMGKRVHYRHEHSRHTKEDDYGSLQRSILTVAKSLVHVLGPQVREPVQP